jgi:PST family polysaccharide transporter
MKDLYPHSLQKMWKGAMILTIAGILTKILSAAYRVPFQNIVGDVGFYIYQQVYPFYGVAIILSTYGFPVVISKLIAEHPEGSRDAASRKISRIALLFLSMLGGLFFFLLYFGAGSIAAFMGDTQLTILIKIAAFSFLLLPLVSVWRGSFQGTGHMTPTAFSQVFEQLVRVCTILLLAYFLVRAGYSLYAVGAGAMFGSVAGGYAAVLVLLFFYQRYRLQREDSLTPPNDLPQSKSIVKALFLQGFTICISSLLLVLFQMVDAFTIYAWLIEGGMNSQTAKELKGVYDRGQPLIQLGTVVSTAFSLSLVPYITLAKGKGAEKDIKDKIGLSIRVSIAVGAGAAAGLAWLIKPVNAMLFSNENGSNVILVLGLSILFCSISLTAAAILQGLGHPYLPALFVLIGLVVKYVLNYMLIPGYSTLGAALSTIISFGVVAILLLFTLKNITGISIFQRLAVTPLLASIGIMSAILALFLFLTDSIVGESRTLAIPQSLLGVVLGGTGYLMLLIKSHFFTKEELMLLPLGKKLVKLLK